MKPRSVLILSSLVVLSAACGGAEGFDEEFDTLEDELSQNEQCQTATANASFVSDFDPAVSSPTSYGSSSECAGGHLVDVTNYNDFSASHMKNRVGIGLAAPTSEAECEDVTTTLGRAQAKARPAVRPVAQRSAWIAVPTRRLPSSASATAPARSERASAPGFRRGRDVVDIASSADFDRGAKGRGGRRV